MSFKLPSRRRSLSAATSSALLTLVPRTLLAVPIAADESPVEPPPPLDHARAAVPQGLFRSDGSDGEFAFIIGDGERRLLRLEVRADTLDHEIYDFLERWTVRHVPQSLHLTRGDLS